MTSKTKNKFVQAFKIWIAIYPSITLINVAFGEWLSPLPIYLKTFVLTIVLVPWMVFVLLPFINFCERKIFGNSKT